MAATSLKSPRTGMIGVLCSTVTYAPRVRQDCAELWRVDSCMCAAHHVVAPEVNVERSGIRASAAAVRRRRTNQPPQQMPARHVGIGASVSRGCMASRGRRLSGRGRTPDTEHRRVALQHEARHVGAAQTLPHGIALERVELARQRPLAARRSPRLPSPRVWPRRALMHVVVPARWREDELARTISRVAESRRRSLAVDVPAVVAPARRPPTTPRLEVCSRAGRHTDTLMSCRRRRPDDER